MTEDFVPFELAKKLKEKGFNCEYPFAMYTKYEQFCPLYSSDKDYFGIDDFDKHACIAPTISQVLKWLRENKKIHVCIDLYAGNWEYTIKENISLNESCGFIWQSCPVPICEGASYEAAAIAGIEYCLDNLI